MFGITRLKSPCSKKLLRIAFDGADTIYHRHFSVLTHCYADRTFLVDKTARLNRIASSERRTFIAYVLDPKDGYRSQKEVSRKQHIIDGMKLLRTEFKMWTEEMKEHYRADPSLTVSPREVYPLYEFGKSDDISQFIVTNDSDHNEGYSHSTFEKSPAGYGLFSGQLSSNVPKQGQLTKAGYCNITSKRVMKSFQRKSYYDWRKYNTLVLRLRGDGRSYGLLLSTDGLFDVTWHDAYFYVLYTRGGPHWQTTRIPFSKFFLTAKGSTQDKQGYMPSDRVSRLGITAASMDWADGDFRLEIDYIGLEYDPHHREEFAYESYRVPAGIVGT